MTTATVGKFIRSLLAPALMATAFSTPATAADSCACMCVDGAPYYVCNSGFGGYTQEATPSCTEQLANTCPTPDSQPDPQTSGDPSNSSEPELPEPVNAAAEANGLECQRRQVYRPDLAEHKVYTVCMPVAMTEAEARRPEQARGGRSPR